MKNYLKKVILILLVSFQSFAATYEIGVTQIVEHSVLDSIRMGFEKSLKDNNISCNIDYQNAQGDMVTQQLITQNFNTKKKDIVLAISTPSSQAAANSIKNTPILFGAVTSPKESGILSNPNVTGISDAIPPTKLLEITKEFFPSINTIGILYNSSEKNSEMNLDILKKEAKNYNLKIEAIGVTSLSEVPSALDRILKTSNGIYLLPDNLVVSATPLILKNSERKKIPVFSLGYDKTQIDMGVTLGISVDYAQLGYDLGLMAIEILNGTSTKNIPYKTSSNFPVIINNNMLSKYTSTAPEKILDFSK